MVFVNYRNTDYQWSITLDTELKSRFGATVVFRATRSIPPGDNFKDTINAALASTQVMVTIVGPQWLDVRDPESGQPRLGDPEDWVRREIAYALQHQIRVLPVLVEDAPTLKPEQLPAEIAELASLQVLRINSRSAHLDIEALVESIVDEVPGLKPAGKPARRWRPAVLAVGVVVAAIAAALVVHATGGGTPHGPAPATTGSAVAAEHAWFSMAPVSGRVQDPFKVWGAGFPGRTALTAQISVDGRWVSLGNPTTDAGGVFNLVVDEAHVAAALSGAAPGGYQIVVASASDPSIRDYATYTLVDR